MYRLIQKLASLAAVPLLLSAAIPFFVSVPASAATKQAAGGSCLLERQTVTQVSQTTEPNTVSKCKTLMPSGKDANGKKFSTKSGSCYGVSETDGKYVIVESLKCTDPRLTGTAGSTGGGSPTSGTCTNSDQSTCPDAGSGSTGGSSAPPAGGGCMDLSKCDLIKNYLNPLVGFLSALVGVAVVISIIIGGIQYGSSAGDSAKVTAAKNRIRNSIIALIVYLFLFTLLNFLIPGNIV